MDAGITAGRLCAGPHGIDANAMGSERDSHGARQRPDAVPGDRVGDVNGKPEMLVDRAHVDDRARLAARLHHLDHVARHRLPDDEIGTQVDGNDPVKLLDGQIEEVAVADDGRIVGEDRGVAEGLRGYTDEFRTDIRLTDIGRVEVCRLAKPLRLGLASLRVAIDHQYARTLLDEAKGDGEADALRGSGDDGDLSVEAIHTK